VGLCSNQRDTGSRTRDVAEPLYLPSFQLQGLKATEGGKLQEFQGSLEEVK
jgi:hypothetical protein